MGVETHTPRRALIVFDDAAMCGEAAALLASAGVDATAAADGEEALTLFARQWFPVLVTDRRTPLLDGVELVRRVRAIAVSPVYVVMLAANNDLREHESGYCAGVDHFLAKRNYRSELVARVETGLLAVERRRRTLSGRGDDLLVVDLASGAHTARHLIGRLHAEIAVAARRGSRLTVLSVCIETQRLDGAVPANFEAATHALLAAVREAARPKLDWIASLPTPANMYRLAIVMPESGSAADAVAQHIRNAFANLGADASVNAMHFSIGAASLSDWPAQPTALELLGESERRRRGLSARASSAIRNVQGDVSRQERQGS